LPGCFYVGLRRGVPGLAVAWTIAFPLSGVPRLVLVSRILDLSAVDHIAVLRPAFTACAVMAIGVLLAERSLPDFLPHAARPGLEAITERSYMRWPCWDYSVRRLCGSGR
jgi:hypothetical protein